MEAYIYDAVRSVRGKGNKKGALNGVTPTELSRQVLVALKERNALDTSKVEDVIFGCVAQVKDQGVNIAKSAAQESNYGDHLCGVTLNRFCGSGLEAMNQAAAYVKSGFRILLVAGGVESMSRVPMGSDGGGFLMDPLQAIPRNLSSPGYFCRFNCHQIRLFYETTLICLLLNPKEEHQKQRRINVLNLEFQLQTSTGLTFLATDENIRPSTTLEGISKLQPSFAMMGSYGRFRCSSHR